MHTWDQLCADKQSLWGKKFLIVLFTKFHDVNILSMSNFKDTSVKSLNSNGDELTCLL